MYEAPLAIGDKLGFKLQASAADLEAKTIARLGADGVVDATFGSSGLVRTDFESGSSDENAVLAGIGQQSDGRLIAMGWHSANSSFRPTSALLDYEWDRRALLSLVLCGLPALEERLMLRRNRSLVSPER